MTIGSRYGSLLEEDCSGAIAAELGVRMRLDRIVGTSPQAQKARTLHLVNRPMTSNSEAS